MVIPIQNKQLTSLQIGRAVAALTVLYLHTGHTPIFGSFGVDIFFVISGFVMAMIADNQPNIKTFLVDRISRIVPLYWVFTIILFIFSIFWPELLNSTRPIVSNLIKSLFFIPFLKESGGLQPLLFVGWSLNYEMFFYLVIAISLVLTHSFKQLFINSTILILGSYLYLGFFLDDLVLNKFFGENFVFEFILGMGCYAIYSSKKLKNIPNFYFLLIVFAAFLIMALASIYHLTYPRIVGYGIPSALLVLSLVCLESAIPKDSFFSNFFLKIGDASYAIYLSHFFIIDGFRKIISIRVNFIDINSLIGCVVQMGVAVLIGYLIYLYIDKPLHRNCKLFMLKL